MSGGGGRCIGVLSQASYVDKTETCRENQLEILSKYINRIGIVDELKCLEGRPHIPN